MTASGSTVFTLFPERRGERPSNMRPKTLLYRYLITINTDLLLLHAGSEFMGMLNLEAGGFLQIRLP